MDQQQAAKLNDKLRFLCDSQAASNGDYETTREEELAARVWGQAEMLALVNYPEGKAQRMAKARSRLRRAARRILTEGLPKGCVW